MSLVRSSPLAEAEISVAAAQMANIKGCKIRTYSKEHQVPRLIFSKLNHFAFGVFFVATNNAVFAQKSSPGFVHAKPATIAVILQDEAEILPDGNLRDAVPTVTQLTQLVNQSIFNMIKFKAGIFQMGDWGAEITATGMPFDSNYDSKPLHKVSLSAFALGKYPVTYAEFDVFTAAMRLPRINQKKTMIESTRKPKNPAEVTWQGAKDYCGWLALISKQPFDLPTEAQWEYAARSGGKRNLYPTDNGKNEPGRNIPSFEQRKAAGGLTPVGSFPPNPSGVHDMSAGLNEWVNDWYDSKYYQTSPVQDPKGPGAGTERVIRGWTGDESSTIVMHRYREKDEEQTGTWISYSTDKAIPNREIPYTKYSTSGGTSFRCALRM